MENAPVQILLVEDNRDDVMLVETYLKRSNINHETTVVTEKGEFLEMIGSREFDIIVCDHSMPQFNSIDAFEIAAKNIPYVPFIVISGAVSEEDLIRIFEKGADNYVMKDNLKRLPSAILRAIDVKRKLHIKANPAK